MKRLSWAVSCVLSLVPGLAVGVASADPPATIPLPAAPAEGSSAEAPPSAPAPAAAPPRSTQPEAEPEPAYPQRGHHVPPPPAWGAPPAYGARYPYGPPPPPYYVPHPYIARDGLYVRLALGVSSLQSTLSSPVVRLPTGARVGTANDKLTGTGFGVEAAIGGSIRPGLALAFEFGGYDLASPTSSQRLSRPDALSFSHVGALLDWFPDPRGGFHVQGGVGLASMTFDDSTTYAFDLAPGQTVDATEAPDTLQGLTGHAGVGYEWWAARDWSMGILFRVDGAKLTGQGDYGDHQMAVLSPGLRFSITLN